MDPEVTFITCIATRRRRETYVFAQYFLFIYFFIYFLLVYAVKVAGTVVYLVFAGLRAEEGYGAPAAGCRANTVR